MWFAAYAMHRDPRNFSPAPDTFLPERWLVGAQDSDPQTRSHPRARPDDSASITRVLGTEKDEDGEFVHDERAFVPFSYGPMNCVGKGLAMQEIRMVVCALVQRFRFRLKEGWDVREYERNYKDYFVSTRPELPVVVEPR